MTQFDYVKSDRHTSDRQYTEPIADRMSIGVIKAIRTDKRFGFIRCTETEPWIEYFFHASDCTGDPFDSLVPGLIVEFTSYTRNQHDARPRARNIYICQEEPAS